MTSSLAGVLNDGFRIKVLTVASIVLCLWAIPLSTTRSRGVNPNISKIYIWLLEKTLRHPMLLGDATIWLPESSLRIQAHPEATSWYVSTLFYVIGFTVVNREFRHSLMVPNGECSKCMFLCIWLPIDDLACHKQGQGCAEIDLLLLWYSISDGASLVAPAYPVQMSNPLVGLVCLTSRSKRIWRW